MIEHATEKIAAQFPSFYTDLYNLPLHHKPQGLSRDRMSIIKDYLTHSQPPPLKEIDSQKLERPIQEKELRQTIT